MLAVLTTYTLECWIVNQAIGGSLAPTWLSSSCCRVSKSSACLSNRPSFVARLLRAHSCWQAAIPVAMSYRGSGTLLLTVMNVASVRLLALYTAVEASSRSVGLEVQRQIRSVYSCSKFLILLVQVECWKAKQETAV